MRDFFTIEFRRKGTRRIDRFSILIDLIDPEEADDYVADIAREGHTVLWAGVEERH